MNSYMSVVLTTIIILALYFSLVTGHVDKRAALKRVTGQCSGKYNISYEAVLDILSHDHKPRGYDVKCWISCVMKNRDMKKDWEMNWEHCKNLTKESLSYKEDKIAEMNKTKVPQEEKDYNCHLAYIAAVCKINYWNWLGLPKRNKES